jgi:uncharacterized membrane protein
MSITGDEPHHDAPAIEGIDPDEWNAAADAAARARAERRAQRARAAQARADRAGDAATGVARRRLRRRAPAGDAAARSRAARRDPPAGDGLLASTSGRVLAAAAGTLALLTIIGLLALWPGGLSGGRQEAFGGPTLRADVTATTVVDCPGPTAQRCRRVIVRLAEGRDKGRRATLDLGPLAVTPKLAPGDGVRVQPTGATTGARYGYADVDRRAPMLWLAIALGVVAVLVARWRGLLALAGVALSLVLVVTFLVPAILAGSDPILVSLVAALAVMFVTLLLTYGVGPQSLAAALGIGLSLLVAALVGHAMVVVAHLDGRSPELPLATLGVSLQGVVLAGMVIGALGALTDMAVSQASAVMALREANSALGSGQLYRGAFAVGRDHLSATIHTLVLAYVGAALPLLLVLRSGHVGAVDALNGQVVAEPVIATLVGAIALVVAVPATTGLAAILVARVPVAALHGHHAHTH